MDTAESIRRPIIKLSHPALNCVCVCVTAVAGKKLKSAWVREKDRERKAEVEMDRERERERERESVPLERQQTFILHALSSNTAVSQSSNTWQWFLHFDLFLLHISALVSSSLLSLVPSSFPSVLPPLRPPSLFRFPLPHLPESPFLQLFHSSA